MALFKIKRESPGSESWLKIKTLKSMVKVETPAKATLGWNNDLAIISKISPTDCLSFWSPKILFLTEKTHPWLGFICLNSLIWAMSWLLVISITYDGF